VTGNVDTTLLDIIEDRAYFAEEEREAEHRERTERKRWRRIMATPPPEVAPFNASRFVDLAAWLNQAGGADRLVECLGAFEAEAKRAGIRRNSCMWSKLLQLTLNGDCSGLRRALGMVVRHG